MSFEPGGMIVCMTARVAFAPADGINFYLTKLAAPLFVIEDTIEQGGDLICLTHDGLIISRSLDCASWFSKIPTGS